MAGIYILQDSCARGLKKTLEFSAQQNTVMQPFHVQNGTRQVCTPSDEFTLNKFL